MEITLQSNRKFIYAIFGTLMALVAVAVFGLLIGCIIDSFDFGSLCMIITGSVVELLIIIGLICLGRKEKPTYTFNDEEILYTKKNSVAAIKVADIESIVYIRFQWYYAFFALFILLLGNIGGFLLPEITVKEKNQVEHDFGYFGKKDVERLKSLYGDLLTIK